MAIIEVRDLWKKFRLRADRSDNFCKYLIERARRSPNPNKEFWALSEISFEVQQGECLGIIGMNGSGKSTLLKLLTGTLRPTRGEITVRGRRSSLIELGAGFHPDFSGRDNVVLNGLILGMPRKKIRQKFDEIVEFAEIEQFIDVPVKYYSTGMQMRLGFAVATALEPELLIVDEVLAVGDASFQKKCMTRIQAMRSMGTSVLLVSHAMCDIEAICSKAIWLQKGQMAGYGRTEVIAKEYLASQGIIA